MKNTFRLYQPLVLICCLLPLSQAQADNFNEQVNVLDANANNISWLTLDNDSAKDWRVENTGGALLFRHDAGSGFVSVMEIGAGGSNSTALGIDANASGGSATAVGIGADATAANSTAVGRAVTASGIASTAVGVSALASGNESTAVGFSATASAESSTAVGLSSRASGSESTALGRSASASGASSTAVGRTAVAQGDSNTTLGYNAVISTTLYPNATAIGARAQAEQSNALVLGSIPGLNGGTDFVDVGIGTSVPMAALHVKRTDHSLPAQILIEDASTMVANRTLLELINNGNARFSLENTDAGVSYQIGTTGANGNFAVFNAGTPLFSLTQTGRFRIGTSTPAQFDSFPNGNLVIQGTLTENSDVNVKQDIEPLQGQRVLEQLEQLPVSEWAYNTSPESRHIGPMAQDFHKAFGLGLDETKISPRDMAGVNMAAIKALKAENQSLKLDLSAKAAEIAAQQAAIGDLQSELRRTVDALKVRLEAVEATRPLVQASLD